MNSKLPKARAAHAPPVRVPKSTGTLTGVLHSRRVPLRGPITERSAACCINRMLLLATDNTKQPIIIDVESPGGSVRDALAIIRTMNGVRCPIATFSRGAVGGAAVLIAAHGIKGFRVADVNATFSIEAGMGSGSETNGGDLKYRHAVIQMLATDTGRPELEISRWVDKGMHLGIAEAQAGGVIDAIGPKPVFPASAT